MSKRGLKKMTEKYMNVSNAYLDELSKYKYPCKYCGRKMVIYRTKTSAICDHCGHKVYRSDKDEFKDKLGIAIRKAK